MKKIMKKIIRISLWAFFLTIPISSHAAAAEDYYKTGTTFYGNGQYSQAVSCFQASIQLNPNDWRAYQSLGNGDYALGNITEAISAYDKSIDLNPQNTQLVSFVQGLKAKNEKSGLSNAESDSSANSSGSASGFHSGPYLDIRFLFQLGNNGTGSDVLAGWGPNLGYSFDKNWAAQFEFNSGRDVSNSTIGYGFSRVIGEAKYTFDSGNPYLVAGAGMDWETVSNVTQSYPDFLAGLGVQANIFDGFRLFLEAKINFILTPGSITTGVPVSSGMQVDF